MKKKIPIIIISIIFSIILWGTISLSGEYYSNVEVPLKIIDLPNGYTIGSELPSKILLKLKGEGWKLFSVNIGKDVTYDVSVKKGTGAKDLKLMDHLADNRWILSDLEVIDIIPQKITCTIEKKIKKKLLVSADLNLDFKAGYGLATPITIEPDSVIVEGPGSLLNSIESVKTKVVRLSSLDKRTIKNISFADLLGSVFDTKFVSITLDIQRIVDKQFDGINVDIIDVPPDRDVILLPNKIDCSVRGGIDILGKLHDEDFKAYVYYRDIVLDTLGSIVPRLDIPNNTSLIYIKPGHVRYIIKKFR